MARQAMALRGKARLAMVPEAMVLREQVPVRHTDPADYQQRVIPTRTVAATRAVPRMALVVMVRLVMAQRVAPRPMAVRPRLVEAVPHTEALLLSVALRLVERLFRRPWVLRTMTLAMSAPPLVPLDRPEAAPV